MRRSVCKREKPCVFVFYAAPLYIGFQMLPDQLNFRGDKMGKIAILPKNRDTHDPHRHLLTRRSLPVRYMGDFSIPGILVDRLPEAIRLLEEHRFEIITQNRCSEIVTNDLQHLRELFGVLDNEGIDYGFADLADRIYQG